MRQDDNHWCELGFAEPAVVFKGPTQTARSVTEAWVALHGFCPNCAADRLPQLPNNSPVADFRCGACPPFPLSSFRGSVARPGTQRRARARSCRERWRVNRSPSAPPRVALRAPEDDEGFRPSPE